MIQKKQPHLSVPAIRNNPYRQLKHLKTQEHKALVLLHKGLTNVEMAKEMKRSTKTIESYTSVIYDILNVANRVKAALFYERFLVAHPAKETSHLHLL